MLWQCLLFIILSQHFVVAKALSYGFNWCISPLHINPWQCLGWTRTPVYGSHWISKQLLYTHAHTHTLYTPVPTTFLSATFVHHLLSSTCSVFLYHPVWGYNALLSSIFLPSSELFFIDPWLFLRHWWQIAFEESLFQAYLAWVIIIFHLLPLPRRRDMQLEQLSEAASAPVSEVKHFNGNISKRPFANQ